MPPRRAALAPDTDILAHLLALPPATRAAALAMLGEEDGDALDRAWELWAHRGQLPPAERTDWRTWVLMAGRGFGKTLAGAKWITQEVADHAAGRSDPLKIALVGATLEDARRVMIEGKSGLLEVADAWIEAWHPSLHRLTFRTGAEATLFSGAHPDRLRGPEHHLAWCDELAKWERPGDTWDMLQLGLRLGAHPRALVTTTPRSVEALTRIMADPDTVVTGGRTAHNPHTSAAWKRAVERIYAGTRLGRQELDGELLTDAPGALWTVELLASCRAQGSDWAPIARHRVEPASAGQPARRSGDRTDVTDLLRDGLGSPEFTRTAFARIVIGVDPPTAGGTCGIIVCAKDESGIAHVLADHSVTGLSPEGWARAVADAARIHSAPPPAYWGSGTAAGGGGVGLNPPRHGEVAARSADGGGPGQSAEPADPIPTLIVAEVNQGGRMVEAVLRGADPNLHVRRVTAQVGKSHRAEPVARLFEAGQVVLHGRLPELEAQLLGMIAGGGYDGPGDSPDRADAMVWALTELMLKKERGLPQVRGI